MSVTRTRAWLAAGAVASIAIGAGVGAVVVHGKDVTHDQQQATANAAASAAAYRASVQTPITAGVRSDGSHYGSLYAYLLPMPAGDSLGPDIGSVGDDNFVSGVQIVADVKVNLLKLPKSDMNSSEGTLADLHLQGLAVRSMVTSDGTAEYDFELMQLDPKAASQDESRLHVYVNGLGYRQGASVPGDGTADCVLPPGLGSDTLDEMICIGNYGDVEVLLQVSGQSPLDQNAAVGLLAQQLDRLKSDQTVTAGSADQGDQNE